MNNPQARKRYIELYEELHKLCMQLNISPHYTHRAFLLSLCGLFLNKLNKKCSTFSKLSGPPKLNNTIAFFIYNFLQY